MGMFQKRSQTRLNKSGKEIHYFLLPPKLNMLGVFFTETVNPIFEFVITTFFVLIVITLSILVGRIIRLSPTFSHYLLGTNIKI